MNLLDLCNIMLTIHHNEPIPMNGVIDLPQFETFNFLYCSYDQFSPIEINIINHVTNKIIVWY